MSCQSFNDVSYCAVDRLTQVHNHASYEADAAAAAAADDDDDDDDDV